MIQSTFQNACDMANESGHLDAAEGMPCQLNFFKGVFTDKEKQMLIAIYCESFCKAYLLLAETGVT